MKAEKVMLMVVAALLVCAVTAALGARPDEPARGLEGVKLSPEEQAFLDRAKELHKGIRIAGLELALMEAKDAPEDQIASKAEELYRAQGKLYALRAKNRDMARKLWRHGPGHQWGHGPGRRGGRGLGPGWDGPGMGRHGRRGMGRGMGPGWGGHGGPGMGRGMRRGMGRGGGHWMGPGFGLGEPGMGFGMGPRMGRG